MELTHLQKQILNAPEQKIIVQACAAALKTSTLTEKVRQLLKTGIDPASIAVITFTRMAAQELVERLGNDYKDGLFIGTIHALAAHFLSKVGLGAKINKIAEEEEFDKLFTLCKKIDLHQAFEWICLDEAQDCSEKELEFIFDMINPRCYFICLDFNQSIYGFKGARPDILKEYINKEGTYYSLNENFRNGSLILAFAKSVLSSCPMGFMYDDSTAMRPVKGEIIKEKFYPQDFINTVRSSINFKDWAVLCRTNADVDRVIRILEDNYIPCATFKQGELNKKQLEALMIGDTVKVLTVHSSKGLAWDNVCLYKLWWKQKTEEETRLNYVAVTRARNKLIIYK